MWGPCFRATRLSARCRIAATSPSLLSMVFDILSCGPKKLIIATIMVILSADSTTRWGRRALSFSLRIRRGCNRSHPSRSTARTTWCRGMTTGTQPLILWSFQQLGSLWVLRPLLPLEIPTNLRSHLTDRGFSWFGQINGIIRQTILTSMVSELPSIPQGRLLSAGATF